MKIINVALELLEQIKNICLKLDEKDYSASLEILGKSSIGAHNRHSIEFFQMLILGLKTGTVSYDKRKHDFLIESSPSYAIESIITICDFLKSIKQNVDLELEVEYPLSHISAKVKSNLEREIIYNIEHLVHHMAIIKIGINENFEYLQLDSTFGIAQSTIAYQNSEA